MRGKLLQNRVEPPVLLSRLLTLVFIALVVIVGVLTFTLYNMFPLNRPEVFFLRTQTRDNLEIRITELPAKDENLEAYKFAFIREYIKARNEVTPNIYEMRKKWENSSTGLVRIWSTPEVYTQLTETNMWRALMFNIPDFEFSCSVEFPTNSIDPESVNNEYFVNFSYFCSNSGGQLDKKDYKIKIKLDLNEDGTIKWQDRLTNPLGLRVSEYKVESGNGDPLNTGYLPN